MSHSIETEQFAAVETLKKGEYVKRKQDAKKVYIRSEYCRESKGYLLQDCDDHCRTITVKKGVKLFVGFSY